MEYTLSAIETSMYQSLFTQLPDGNHIETVYRNWGKLGQHVCPIAILSLHHRHHHHRHHHHHHRHYHRHYYHTAPTRSPLHCGTARSRKHCKLHQITLVQSVSLRSYNPLRRVAKIRSPEPNENLNTMARCSKNITTFPHEFSKQIAIIFPYNQVFLMYLLKIQYCT